MNLLIAQVTGEEATVSTVKYYDRVSYNCKDGVYGDHNISNYSTSEVYRTFKKVSIYAYIQQYILLSSTSFYVSTCILLFERFDFIDFIDINKASAKHLVN